MRILFASILFFSSVCNAKPATPKKPAPDDSAALATLILQKDTTVQTVTQFLNQHRVTNTYTRDSLNGHETLLQLSLRLRKLDIFSVLYDYFKQPDPNALLPDKDASLYTKVLRYGDWPLIQKIKALGGDVTKLTNAVKGRTELFYAAESNSAEVIRHFLNQGVNTADAEGFTPLMKAASDNDDSVITLLLNSGADVRAKTQYDSTALLEAGCYPGVIHHLIAAGSDIHAVNVERSTALHVAAQCDDVEDVRALLQAGLSVSAKDKYGYTPLVSATFGNALNAMKLLIEANSAIEATDRYGSTPLFSARTFEAAKVLIEAGANVNAAWPRSHFTLLMSLMGEIDVLELKLLLHAGADVNATTDTGGTVLMQAALFSSKEVIQTLLAAGAIKHAVDSFGESAYTQAVSMKRSKEILDLLK
jgi:ankyrin repeat protein